MLEQRLTVAGSEVAIRMAGDGEPLLVLHGMSDGGAWHPYQEQLAAQHAVIAPDHPGFGSSARPAWLQTMSDLVHGYLELVDALGLRGVNVVASCFGGWLAAELAAFRPELFRKLVLVAPLGLKAKGVSIEDVFMLSLQALPDKLYHQPPAIELSPELIARQMSDRKTLALLAWNPFLHNPRLAAWLHRVTARVLLVWGANDRVLPVAHAEAWRRELPESRLVTVEACGHLPHLERPAETVSAIETFLQE